MTRIEAALQLAEENESRETELEWREPVPEIGEIKRPRARKRPRWESSKECSRCGCKMLRETFTDLMSDRFSYHFQGWRCPVCGEIWDPVIEAHRKIQHRTLAARN